MIMQNKKDIPISRPQQRPPSHPIFDHGNDGERSNPSGRTTKTGSANPPGHK